MNRWLALGFLAIVGAALALRCPRLEERPMHNDEAVNAVKFGQLWQNGAYKYDPNEHHGPSLFYATLVLGRLTGAPDYEHWTDPRLRLVPVLFGAGLLLLLPLIADGLGRRAALWAALFTAVSPAMVFYSRYYIHEILLVFFTLLALAAGWRYWRSGKLGWALLLGLALGLMHATKETFVLTLTAAALALLLNRIWNRVFDASLPPPTDPPLKWPHLIAAVGVWAAVAFLFLSSFFTNPHGPLDSLRTYVPWIHRAGGASPHTHAWTFYLHRLLFFQVARGPVWTEALIFLLALIGAFAGFDRKRLGRGDAGFVRFVALYTFFLMAIYSVIPYKTPWCLLGFWHGTILLAGVGAAVLWRAIRLPTPKAAFSALLLAGAAHLAWEAWQANVNYAADRRNPYVYAQTSPDLRNLIAKVESLAQVHSDHRGMLIKVMAPESDYWPLPWYLRRFRRIGFWDALPADPYAPVMIVAANLHAALDEKKSHLMVGYFELRPEVFLELYVELDLWKAWLAKHPPEDDENPAGSVRPGN